jgi:predicted Zn-dependent protease
MRLKTYLFLLFSILAFSSFAQPDKTQALAKQYFQTGDYVKAAALFEELWKENPGNTYYYTSLYNSYLRLNAYDDAEKLVKKQIKKFKDELSYQVDWGYIYSQNNDSKTAKEIFDEVLKQLSPDENKIRNTASKFISIRQMDYAAASYLRGREILKDKTLFGFELGNVYLQENKAKEAVSAYLQLIVDNPWYKNSVQSILANYLDKDSIQEELEIQLYTLVQKNSNNIGFNELLIWLYTHQEDFEQALIQAKALDKRNKEDGWRIFDLAANAVEQKQFDAAIDAYEYIQTKGDENRFYQLAQSGAIDARKQKITQNLNYTTNDLLTLKEEYTIFLNQYGKTVETVRSIEALAALEAYYLHDIYTAIQLTEEAIALPGLKSKIKNELKLVLGDYYVLYGDVWEATLLYAQVDKAEKDSPLGEDARFRNAKLSYYKGEFEWAQAQLSILKGATTELIANNALELSVFILDNLGLDSITSTMQLFAAADLLHIQNKDEQALTKLDEILTAYPGHALTDDIYLKQANILIENKKFEEAINKLKLIIESYGEDILADNALFLLGDIYQNYLKLPEQAMAYYKLIITDYGDSVLLVEARKRFRFLRGDDA